MNDEMRQISLDFLEIAAITQPPVDPFCIAEALGHAVQWTDAGDAIWADAAQGIIYLDPAERRERQCFVLAHELCELSLLACFPEETPQRRHRVALYGASELLMPACWFDAQARSCGGDLRRLKACFSNVSNEALAYRLLRTVAAVVSIFDHARLSRRVGSPGLVFQRRRLLPVETRLVHEVTRTEADVRRQDEYLDLAGYWIYEPGWPRVVLITQPAMET